MAKRKLFTAKGKGRVFEKNECVLEFEGKDSINDGVNIGVLAIK